MTEQKLSDDYLKTYAAYLRTIKVDEESYEFKERLAILELNNPDMHPVHARNKAIKEIRIRIAAGGCIGSP